MVLPQSDHAIRLYWWNGACLSNAQNRHQGTIDVYIGKTHARARADTRERMAMEIDLGRAFDALPAMVWTARPDGHIDFANRRWSDYTGFSLDAAHGWDWQATIYPDDLPTVLERWRSILASGEPGEIEARLRRDDGQCRWFVIHCSPMRDDAGRIIKWCGVGTDVDAFRRAEATLRERELDFQLIVDGIPGLVGVHSAAGEVEFINKQNREYFGRTLEELKRWGTGDACHPEDLPRAIKLFTRSIETGEPFDFEVRARRFDGVYRWFQSRGLPVRDATGCIVRWYNLLVDIDERKRAEEALAASERNFKLTIDTIPALAWAARTDGSAEFFNQHYLDYVGLSSEHAEGWGWTDAVHPDDRDGLAATWQTIRASEKPGEAEARLRRFDGEYRWLLFRVNPLRDDKDNVVRWYGTNIDIEDRKRSDEALRLKERELDLIINTIPTMAWSARPDGSLAFFNQHYLHYVGLSIGQSKDWVPTTALSEYWDLTAAVHPDDVDGLTATWEAILASGRSGEAEARIRRFDGIYRWFLVRANPLCDEAGNIVKWYGVSIDIDDRKRAEEALRVSERNFKLTIDAIPALAWSAHADGSAEFLSQQYLDYVGLSAEQAQGWGWTVAVHPDDLSGLAATWQAIIASGKQGETEARLRRFDGEYRWLLFRVSPLRGAWYGVNTDIDDRKRAETNLAREKHLLEMIASSSPLRDVLGALCEMVEEAGPGCYCDVHPIDWSGPTIEYSVAPSLPATYTDPIAGLSISGDALPCAIAAQQKIQVVAGDIESDPRWRTSPVRTHVLDHGLRSVWSTPIYAKDGRVLGTLCLYQRQPATPSPQHQSLIAHATRIASIAIERSRTEEALRRSEAFLAEGQHLARMGNFAWHVATGEITWSEQLCRIFQFDPGVPVTLELIASRVHPEDMPLISDMVERATRGESDFEYQHRIVLPDDSIKHLHLIAHRSRGDPGQLEYIGAVLDISQRRLAEEALSKARSDLAHVTRITSLGALTASIAHEVNQPLSGIITNAGTCLRMLAAEPPNIDVARETARRTIRDGNRAADVITRLRTLFSKRAASIEPIDLNEAAREVMALCSEDLQRSGVRVSTELADGLPPVGGDRVQLQQVIMNLLRNGADAMSGIDDRPRRMRIRTEHDEDDHVRLSVQDAGIGFGPDGTERLFEAFYTTKSDGMGIGLSVSRSIIEHHHGRLWATSNDGPGATFSFSIPEYFREENPVHEVGVLQAPVASNTESSTEIS
ncbi:MAG: PAS domain S-box protein [Mesorhizobium sp.]|nr:PAS domain S-box protein [Mesorhizobium sp. M5C.F.Cr.IN.023.01.1.1]RWF88269.1 MAG: PAS domain S-box protein [Mesorhizobium sp.]RWF93111.1 MAG: PAS domain S-box protein [Mesorhizobium sp.]RWI42362.1 MAG: PAS domain S-box protein [Mesorhizobium sp.]RWI53570.1 MAG: PAS domain S-box protein [Mesorhizobium sp.]